MNYKKIIINIGKGLVLLLAFLFILTKCASCGNEVVVKKSNNDSLFSRMKADSLKILELQSKLLLSEVKNKALDSAKLIIENKYQIASKKLRNKIKIGICDTFEVVKVLNECDSVIDANHEVISQRDSSIAILKEITKEQADEIAAARQVIKNKDSDIENLEKALKKTKRRNKIKTALIIIGDVAKDVLLIFALK